MLFELIKIYCKMSVVEDTVMCVCVCLWMFVDVCVFRWKMAELLTLVLLNESGFCICGRCDHDQENVILNGCENGVLFRLKRVDQLITFIN